jgi:hypothetical protein
MPSDFDAKPAKPTLRYPGEGGTVEFLNRAFGAGVGSGLAVRVEAPGAARVPEAVGPEVEA